MHKPSERVLNDVADGSMCVFIWYGEIGAKRFEDCSSSSSSSSVIHSAVDRLNRWSIYHSKCTLLLCSVLCAPSFMLLHYQIEEDFNKNFFCFHIWHLNVSILFNLVIWKTDFIPIWFSIVTNIQCSLCLNVIIKTWNNNEIKSNSIWKKNTLKDIHPSRHYISQYSIDIEDERKKTTTERKKNHQST